MMVRWAPKRSFPPSGAAAACADRFGPRCSDCPTTTWCPCVPSSSSSWTPSSPRSCRRRRHCPSGACCEISGTAPRTSWPVCRASSDVRGGVAPRRPSPRARASPPRWPRGRPRRRALGHAPSSAIAPARHSTPRSIRHPSNRCAVVPRARSHSPPAPISSCARDAVSIFPTRPCRRPSNRPRDAPPSPRSSWLAPRPFSCAPSPPPFRVWDNRC
mmetsp:Transcript_27755/g.66882  ORF Transcript_27755/g.66882 Transcript_27755/m.66882 type:complete len:215 (-) Transcript_27755:209-853(-)